ncbi:MAG: RNA-binding protein [Bacteroidales bacterium]|nr:RNA-binding protein [Bacteroidales bacterium]MBQ3575905.1 RNA-binding protein [Coprobacter sp.]MBR2475858.1 RNA-binding protein [Bacteroidaceae bacterium]MBQ3555433.1 RNA-binding protein [Bacteroidales bacterium]MBR3608309.1 RNA-binding protein [Bacteroidales bacterium]
MNIYVGNLNFRVKEPQLQEAFEAFGEVTLVKIVRNKETGRSKGFGFVEMSDDDKARTAIESLNNSEFEGRRMIVSQARPKPEK